MNEKQVMHPYKNAARIALADMVDNAIGGYGKGNAIKHIIDVLKKAVPKDLHGFIQHKDNWQ